MSERGRGRDVSRACSESGPGLGLSLIKPEASRCGDLQPSTNSVQKTLRNRKLSLYRVSMQ